MSNVEQVIHIGKPEVNPKQYEQSAKPLEPAKEYTCVRTRRGQAIGNHNLVERVSYLDISSLGRIVWRRMGMIVFQNINKS